MGFTIDSRAKWRRSSSFNGNRNSTSFRLAISHVTVDSRSMLNCSTLGGKRVIPDDAWEKSDMAVLSEVTELLRRWEVWKRVEAAPERIDELERRLVNLESKLKRAPGEACPKCGALEFRTTRTEPLDGQLGELGMTYRYMECGACKHTGRSTEKPKA
jgi:hypothetical protein